jgi:hypothetical protein
MDRKILNLAGFSVTSGDKGSSLIRKTGECVKDYTAACGRKR